MKISLVCLFIALFARCIFEIAAQDVPEIHALVIGGWLTVYHADRGDRQFDPSFTFLVSDFKPIAKKRSDGKYEIKFVP